MNDRYLDRLVTLLKSDDRLLVEEDLNKNRAAELARQYDPGLLNLLQSDDKICEFFFAKTQSGLVFKKDIFLQFLSNKAFLPDSYTAYKNKIGLATDTDELLSEKQDVVLNWPYKDAVLEGGQDKEDTKRSEVFFNEVLAPDQITRLLDDKVFTSWKRYDKAGEHPLEDLKTSDSLLLKGNNLVILHSLRKRYAGAVKLIYIDPPYNIGDDGFNYNDRFNHSTWLTFIRNRLIVAKDLMREDGILFVHIGDKEMHYLKVLLDEIFPGGFVATVPRKTRSGKSDVPYNLSQDFDWLLIFAKSADASRKLFGRDVERKYYKTDEFESRWRLADLTTQRSASERPNSDFTMINPKNGDKYPVNPTRVWGVTKDTFDDYYKKGRIVFPGDYNFLKITGPVMREFEENDLKNEKKTYVSSNFLNIAMDTLLQKATNDKGTDDIKELFGEKAFSYPKNELLLQAIIESCTQEGDLVVDFFLGSGTTAAVSHKLNRQYIGVEQMNYVTTITVPRLQKVIAGDNAGISKDIDWQGGGSFVYAHIKNDANDFRERVKKAATDRELQELLSEAQKSSFLSYRVDPTKLNPGDKDFKSLSIAYKKQLLLELIDNNTLYVNYSDINDKSHAISTADKKHNAAFYGYEG